MIYVPRYGLKTFHHTSSQRGQCKCVKRRGIFLSDKSKMILLTLMSNKYNDAKHFLNVPPDNVFLLQLTVQELSWNVSSVGSTICSSCFPNPVRELPNAAAPITNKSWSLHQAVMKTLAWTGTVVCSAPVKIQVNAWSWLWSFLRYAITSKKSILIYKHDEKMVGQSKIRLSNASSYLNDWIGQLPVTPQNKIYCHSQNNMTVAVYQRQAYWNQFGWV